RRRAEHGTQSRGVRVARARIRRHGGDACKERRARDRALREGRARALRRLLSARRGAAPGAVAPTRGELQRQARLRRRATASAERAAPISSIEPGSGTPTSANAWLKRGAVAPPPTMSVPTRSQSGATVPSRVH